MSELIAVLICLFLNALLSGAEMAFVSVNRGDLRKLAPTNPRARLLLLLHKAPERTLSVVQIGITIVGILAGALSGTGAMEFITPTLISLGLEKGIAEAAAILIVTLPLTYLSVVFGELVPKSVALRNPLHWSLASGPWLYRADKLLLPMVNLLEKSTKRIVRLIPKTPPPAIPLSPSGKDVEDELANLGTDHQRYVSNLIMLGKECVEDAMVPWEQVVILNQALSVPEVETLVTAHGHTRMPVLDQGVVKGLLNTKEFAALRFLGREDWQTLIRPIIRFQTVIPIIQALKHLLAQGSHLALVCRGKEPVGIVTLEDIFEEVVGDIYDEDDDGALFRLLVSTPRFRSLGRARRPRPGTPESQETQGSPPAKT